MTIEDVDDIAVMLRRRAFDIPDDLEPPWPPALVDTATEQDRQLNRHWIAAAAALCLVVVLVGRVAGTTEEQAPSTPSAVTSTSASAPAIPVAIGVRHQEPSAHPNGFVASATIADGTGTVIVDEMRAPRATRFDEDAEADSAGDVLRSDFPPIALSSGTYALTVTLWRCNDNACTPPVAGASCAASFTVTETQNRFVVEASSGGRCTLSPSPSPSEMQAADDKLRHQQARGWVPYAGDPAWPEVIVPPAWTPAGLGSHANCTRPPQIDPLISFSCIYAEPNGQLIGYHLSNTGYVPKDLLNAAEVNRAVVRSLRALLGNATVALPDQTRAEIEQTITALENATPE